VTRTSSFVRVAAAYVIALAAAAAWLAWGPSTPHVWLDALIADLVATLVVFVASRLHHNSSFYDAYWSVAPPFIAAYWWGQHPDGASGTRFWLLFTVMMIWAIRLTGNWIYGFPGLHHEDWRYPLLRERAGRWEFFADLFGTHVIPTIQVFIGLLPVYVVTTQSTRGFNALDVVAVIVGLGAITLETAADVQMHRFVRDRQPGQAMDRGLWSWSRHPNYFGEFSFWVSLALFGLAAEPGDWWQIVGAVLMLALFLGASIPMMEERSLERRPSYQDVVDRVSKFVPRPPRKARA
jgi:steroid 5-alpha reductase family enzyme